MAYHPLSGSESSLRPMSPSGSLLGTARTPLPKAQLAAVYAIKLTIPIASQQLKPYINQMIEDLHLSGARTTGYYSGVVGSLTDFAHLLSVYPFSRTSDKIGRVPVVVVSTLGLTVFSTAFGLSHSFAGILVTRFFVGIFSGMNGTIHSIVGDLTDSTNASIVFPIYDICSAVGFIIGPLIGGRLESPAKHHPAWFTAQIWHDYPYLLACLATSAISLAACALATFFLRETNKRPSAPAEEDAAFADAAAPLSASELFRIPGLRATCLSSGLIGFFGTTFNAVMVLEAYTPVAAGGLAFPPAQIGYIISLMGLISIPLKLALPFVLRTRSATAVFVACMRIWPLTFAAFPVLSMLSRAAAHGVDEGAGAGWARTMLWAGVCAVLFMSRVGTLTFGLVMILVKEHTPSHSALGAANGICEVLQIIGGSVGHLFIGSLFAFSVSTGALGGALWVVVMVALSVAGAIYSDRGLRKYARGTMRLEHHD